MLGKRPSRLEHVEDLQYEFEDVLGCRGDLAQAATKKKHPSIHWWTLTCWFAALLIALAVHPSAGALRLVSSPSIHPSAGVHASAGVLLLVVDV